MLNIFKHNPKKLKDELENIYQAFENESRNFNLFVHIYDYMEKLKHPVLKDKIKNFESITEQNLIDIANSKAFNQQVCSKTELEQELDNIFAPMEITFPYFTLYAISDILKKHKDKEPVKFREIIDTNFTKKYRKYFDFLLTSLHEDLMEYLDEKIFLSNNNIDKIYFDKEKSILHIKGKKVKIKRKADLPIEHYILEYLFEQDDKTEEVYYQDIATEKLRELEYNNKTDWKKYYNACERLQVKIQAETNINNFLIFTTNKTGNVKINKKYLEFLD